jgi:subtilase family protein
MREALKNLNPELVLEMRRRGKDFFWQPLPPGTNVLLPALSKLVKSVSVDVTEENGIAMRAKILAWAKSFYWQVGPITLGAIKKANPLFFASDSREAVEEAVPKKRTRKTSAVLPSVPTFHTLKIRKEKESEAANVLASLTNSGVASGGISKQSFLEADDVLSPCAASEDQTEDWFGQAVHADQVTISKLNLSKIKIAILDSGIDYKHDAFKNDLWDGSVAEDDDLDRKLSQTVGIDFTGPAKSNDIRDLSPISHGTHVSGIASGAAIARVLRAFQVSEIGNNVKIMPLKVVDSDQHINIQAAENAIQFAQQFDAKIVSASWTVNKDVNLQTQMLHNQGTLFVLAAGNGVKVGDAFTGLDLEREGNQRYPASFGLDNAIAVGALTRDGHPADFSNFGTKTVQVFAPGCRINSTVAGNDYHREDGTSQAAPFVSLTAALIWAQNPDLSPIGVKRRIVQTADPRKDSLSKSVAGNLNLAKAISITEDLYEDTDGIYVFGEFIDPKIAIAGVDESCDEIEPLDVRGQKLTRIYRNYADSGKDVAVLQSGIHIEGKICPAEIHFKPNFGAAGPVQITHVRDMVFKMK